MTTELDVSADQQGRRSLRVVIVDDDPLVRSGLRLILGAAPDVDVVGEGRDGAEAADLAERLCPDVVLMDIRMPGTDGVAATPEVLARCPSARVLVLTTLDSDTLVLRALRAGARGFLLKDDAPVRLLPALREVARGEHALSPGAMSLLVAAATRPDRSDRQAVADHALACLTPREREVALAVGQGRSNAEIAADLHLSLPTVKAHVSRVMEKLGVGNRVQLALEVHGLR
ncbi:response regulator transcription factor [Intrasporangium calvum]|uniref:Response regulator transcription factor n=1 Tax=Intrasporangium calvum TaxID=53358 RepID=A0ABT5GN38_9MICO|nr:response regulator transcription factor [Intrasporangium calvum]MDC5699076.1 response regulator transcription factor [Intrasporangium calvum]